MVWVHNDIVQLLDSNKNVILMSFDLSCAFDTVDHTQLIEKLHHCFGMGGTVLSWLISYLQNRQFFVKLDDVTSENIKLFSGVPQKSILGPLLFGSTLFGDNILFFLLTLTQSPNPYPNPK